MEDVEDAAEFDVPKREGLRSKIPRVYTGQGFDPIRIPAARTVCVLVLNRGDDELRLVGRFAKPIESAILARHLEPKDAESRMNGQWGKVEHGRGSLTPYNQRGSTCHFRY